MKTAFIYCRTARFQESNFSLHTQIERCCAYCKQYGYAVTGVFTDVGYSGLDYDRPGLRQMIKRVVAGQADVVVMTSLDRLTRRADHWFFLNMSLSPSEVLILNGFNSCDVATELITAIYEQCADRIRSRKE